MRTLIAAVMTSLDGVIQAPGGPGEDRSSGFALGGWAWPYASEGEAMDGLFTGPSAERRRFLDRLVLSLDPAHGRRANDFERAMRSRNRLGE